MKKSLFIILTLIIITFSRSQNIDCVGSSITRNGYPRYADSLMIANDYAWRVHNYGLSGAGVVQNAYKDTSLFADVIHRKSEIVILLLGAADWRWYSIADQSGKGMWESEYKYLVDEFKKFSAVVLGYLIHRVDVGSDVTLANATMDEMNLVINKIASDYGLTIIDFKTAIGTNPANFWPSDGLHPNRMGSELMGKEAYEHLITLISNLGIDDEYKKAIEDYDDQKPSLFNGCSMKRNK